MKNQTDDIPGDTADIKSLATLIVELNIARRNSSAYPKGHPVVASSLAKVLRVYEKLLNDKVEFVLGVTSDSLMVNGVVLEKTNVVYKGFSRVLFERGIGALVFHPGLTISELTNFTTILGLKREQIHQHGGIEQVWGKAHIVSLKIRPIRYDLFLAADEETLSTDHNKISGEGLWDRFARELTLSDMPQGTDDNASLDPEILAQLLNRKYAGGDISESDVRETIAAFFAPKNDDLSSETNDDSSHMKLATFIKNLTPELSRQFIDSSFGSKSQDRQTATEQVLANLTDNSIFETLEEINQERLNLSPVVFGLLQRLGQNVSTPQNIDEEVSKDIELSNKMKTILLEHSSEEFVPDDYQKKLNHIIASNQIPSLNIEMVPDLLATLENRSIENSIGLILMNLIYEGVETPEERDLLLINLSDMFSFFLQTGDYCQLHIMMDQITDGKFPIEIQYRLRDEYGRREFLEEILDGLTIWGKPRFDDIRSLIHKFGGHFIEAILDRLSEEKNMSLRRFFMDCLIELGSMTRVPIVNRLYDERWYFLRNLLIILAAQNDPSVVPAIRPLLKNKDPRLRHEVLKTLVHLHDPLAEKQLLEDLGGQNQEKITAAIQLAERCTSSAIAVRLVAILSQGGFSQSECERKTSIVHTLGEIGRAEVLPELAKLLSSRSLLNSRQLTKIKKEIILSLPKYPLTVSRPVLDHIAGGSGEIANLAVETIRIISGKNS